MNPAQAPDVADLTEALASADIVELGHRVRLARKAKNLTQNEVAGGIISPAYLSRIESGTRRPELKILRALAARLETSSHELLLGLSPQQWSERRVELDWAQLSLRTGDAAGALEQTTRLLADLPVGSRLFRRALTIHAGALEATGDYEAAALRLEELIEDGNLDGPPTLEALTALSRVYRQAGELGRAIKVGERGNQRIAELGLEGTPEAVKLTLTVAAAHAESGDMGYAARLCRKALKHAEALRTPNERAGCYWNASIIESRRGNHAAAVALGQKALHILDEADSTRNNARLRTQLGHLHLQVSPPQIDEALAHLTTAETELLTSEASPADLASNRLGQARAKFLRGHLRKAQAAALECLETVASNVPLISAEAHVLLGQISFKGGDLPGAQARYRQAILALSAMGADRSAAQLWYELGGLWMSLGCSEEALDAFQRAGASTGLQARILVEDDEPVIVEGLLDDEDEVVGLSGFADA